MTLSTLIQIFIALQLFVMGILAAIAYRHYREHYRPTKEHPEEKTIQPIHELEIPVALKQHLIEESKTRFEAALGHSATNLEHQLDTTGNQINDLLMRLVTEVVNDELERYKNQMTELHKQAQTDMSGIRKEISDHEAELKTKLAEEIKTEKEKLLKQIDDKLADAVTSFLLEALQHNIDLGDQTAYMLELLEQHKGDFKAEVNE